MGATAAVALGADKVKLSALVPAVLAAFAFWAQRNIKETDADARQRIAAICSLIRFPDIPASVLLSYHLCQSFMRTFDPDNRLQCMAVSRCSSDL